MRQNCIYHIQCMECNSEGAEVKYFGESARALFDRGEEHLEAHEKRLQESVLVEHEGAAHGGAKVEWTMKALPPQGATCRDRPWRPTTSPTAMPMSSTGRGSGAKISPLNWILTDQDVLQGLGEALLGHHRMEALLGHHMLKKHQLQLRQEVQALSK